MPANWKWLGFKANQIKPVPENISASKSALAHPTNNQIPKSLKLSGIACAMQKLMLAGNKLQTLPAAMAACKNLELLRISANEIAELPSWLFPCRSLSWLAFAGNLAESQKIDYRFTGNSLERTRIGKTIRRRRIRRNFESKMGKTVQEKVQKLP